MSNETSRMTGPARLAACLWILLAALCVAADRAEAANGDLLGVSNTLTAPKATVSLQSGLLICIVVRNSTRRNK